MAVYLTRNLVLLTASTAVVQVHFAALQVPAPQGEVNVHYVALGMPTADAPPPVAVQVHWGRAIVTGLNEAYFSVYALRSGDWVSTITYAAQGGQWV